MPYYDYLCPNNHVSELHLSFSEHKKLDSDERGSYIKCNVKYGDLKQPSCGEKAYQIFDKNIGFPGLESAPS